MRRAVVLAAALSLLCAACIGGQPSGGSAPPAADLQAAVQKIVSAAAADPSFSGEILVAKDFVTFASGVNGFGNRDAGNYISTQTPINVGSIGKVFTAVAIGQLVDEGKVGLDDPLSKYMPSYPKPMGDRITIAMLLAHTAGTGDYQNDPGFARVKDTFGTLDELLAGVDTSVSTGVTPGAAYRYSNTGYLLLGKVIEKVTGRDYYDYMNDEIFGRAGIAGGFFENTDDARQLHLYALGYLSDGTTNQSILPRFGTPAGGAYASAKDLLAFHRALVAGTLLKSETLRRLVLQPPAPGKSPIPITPAVFAGDDPGVSAVFGMTESGYTVVVLGTATGVAQPIADRILALVRR